jgi:hypothetical protein
MAEKIKITLGEASGLFSTGLAKLANLNIHSGRDAYALMRSEDLLTPELRTYRETILKLLKRHGARSSLAELRQAADDMVNGKTVMNEQALKDLRAKIVQLEPGEQFTLGPGDEGYPAFVAEANELALQTVELYLDHRVPVKVDALPDHYFSPAEMRALAPIADFIEAAQAAQP